MSFHRSIHLVFTSVLFMSSLFFVLNKPVSAQTAQPLQPIINPQQVYTYATTTRDLKALAARYSDFIQLSSAGKSEYGRELWTADIGKGSAVILLLGSHHAREWITTINSMMLMEQMAQQYEQGASVFGGYRARDLLDRVTFRIVPMVNPDGVTLQQLGLSAFPAAVHPSLIQMNSGSSNFKRWKANGKGIDLNRSYPAGWSDIHNPGNAPYYMNYKGLQPLQAKEAKAMYDLTLSTKPEIAVAYHSSGEILYWNFKTKPQFFARDQAIANAYASLTSYQLVQPKPHPSGGGFTDWFITQFERPGLTPELGRSAGETNVPLSEWNRIWGQQRNTVWLLAKEGYALWMKRQAASPLHVDIRVTAGEFGYMYPDLKSRIVTKVEPGRYTASRLKGDWIEIQTIKGIVWISARSIIKGPFDVLEQSTIAIDANTIAYVSPLAALPSPIILTDQTATIVERWQGWLLIQTNSGTYWIREPKAAVPPTSVTPEATTVGAA